MRWRGCRKCRNSRVGKAGRLAGRLALPSRKTARQDAYTTGMPRKRQSRRLADSAPCPTKRTAVSARGYSGTVATRRTGFRLRKRCGIPDGTASNTHPSFPSEEGIGTTASRDACPTRNSAAGYLHDPPSLHDKLRRTGRHPARQHGPRLASAATTPAGPRSAPAATAGRSRVVEDAASARAPFFNRASEWAGQTGCDSV